MLLTLNAIHNEGDLVHLALDAVCIIIGEFIALGIKCCLYYNRAEQYTCIIVLS